MIEVYPSIFQSGSFIKLLHFFVFLFFILPIFSHANGMEEARKHWRKAEGDWKRHVECVEKFNKSEKNLSTPQKIALLEESLEWCKRAYTNYTITLKRVDKTASNIKLCNEWIETTRKRTDEVQAAIQRFKQEVQFGEALPKINATIKMGDEKFASAHALFFTNPTPLSLKEMLIRIENLKGVQSILHEAAVHYQEAMALLAPFPYEDDKARFLQTYQGVMNSIEECKKGSSELIAQAINHKNSLIEQIALLQVESDTALEEGDMKKSYLAEKNIFPLLKELVEVGAAKEDEFYGLVSKISTLESSLSPEEIELPQ